jgi:carbonic anhydrase/acetyltransferase-like protein (isoleucine patch superfamily)
MFTDPTRARRWQQLSQRPFRLFAHRLTPSLIGQATVLYDTRVGAWASVGDASLVMKHETLWPGHCYRGLPAEEVHEARPPLAAEGTATASRKKQ